MVGAERVSQYPGHIKNVDECWLAIGIHARARNVPRKFRIFEEEKMVPESWRRRELTSIRDLARTANWFVIQVAWRFARRSGSTLFIPYPGREEWGKLEKAKARAKWDAPRRCREGKQRVSGSKKERDVSLMRDLPRTINRGGTEIIRDFVAVTCDANKSFVPITYAHLNLRSRQIRRSASVRQHESRNEEVERSQYRMWFMIAICPFLKPEYLWIIILSAILTSWFNYLFTRVNIW